MVLQVVLLKDILGIRGGVLVGLKGKLKVLVLKKIRYRCVYVNFSKVIGGFWDFRWDSVKILKCECGITPTELPKKKPVNR